MIRFACPGCGAHYTVEDAKAGKKGRCKKCRSKFLIPAAPPFPTPANPDYSLIGPLPQSMPGPPPALPPVEIAPCPGCQARLTVAAAELGSNVECPHCHTLFAAVRPGAIVAPPIVDAEEVPSRNWKVLEPGPDRSGGDDSPRRTRTKIVTKKVGGRVTVSSIGVLSAAKMSGAMSFVAGALVSLVYGFFTLILYLIGVSAGADARGMLSFGLMYVICGLVLYPFLLGISGFIGGAIWALIYNLLATMIGGVEVELD